MVVQYHITLVSRSATAERQNEQQKIRQRRVGVEIHEIIEIHNTSWIIRCESNVQCLAIVHGSIRDLCLEQARLKRSLKLF